MLTSRLGVLLEASLDTFNVYDVSELLAIDMLADFSKAKLAAITRLALLVVAIKQVFHATDGFVHRRGELVRITALVDLLFHTFLG